MSLQTRHFEFEEFRLDLAEKVLLREGAAVPVTPKVFETLQVLVESAGHLVEKDELMQRIWQDRFVEESNLSFNVKMLRKALGDDAARPRFIETVPRRGYRFIAKVREGTAENGARKGSSGIGSQTVPDEPARARLRRLVFPAAAILCIGGVGGGLWYARSGGVNAGPPILSASFSSEKLSANSRVRNAVISPDGKNVAYSNGLGSDRQSVWLRQLDSGNNVQIVPPSDDYYYNLAFSPDGNFIYFARGPKPGGASEQLKIYRTSIFGGIATKIVDEVQGGISVSRDGTRVSFVRCYYQENEWCSLWIADSADGRNERKLVSTPGPIRIDDNHFAPDGRTIAFGTGQSRTGANEYSLSSVDVESGAVREITTERFFNINRIAWLPGGRELLVSALRFPDTYNRIWRVSAVNGEVALLTNDSEDYWGLSLDREGRILVATQPRADFQLRLYRTGDFSNARELSADTATVSFAPDGRLIVSAGQQGSRDIWSINTDGEARQLTNDPLEDLYARSSPDGRWIFFTSNRTGETHLWRMKADGSEQKQMTNVEGGSPLCISPDGDWLYYHSALHRTIRRVSMANGQEQIVLDKPKPIFAVSPDCSQAGFPESEGGESVVTIISIGTGHTRTFRAGAEGARIAAMEWSSDGKGLFYISAVNTFENTTLWVQRLDRPAPRKIAELPGEGLRNASSFGVSPDGTSFAVVQGTWKRDAVLLRGLN